MSDAFFPPIGLFHGWQTDQYLIRSEDFSTSSAEYLLSAIAASALAYDESGKTFELSKEMFALSADPAPATGKYTLTIDDEWMV